VTDNTTPTGRRWGSAPYWRDITQVAAMAHPALAGKALKALAVNYGDGPTADVASLWIEYIDLTGLDLPRDFTRAIKPSVFEHIVNTYEKHATALALTEEREDRGRGGSRAVRKRLAHVESVVQCARAWAPHINESFRIVANDPEAVRMLLRAAIRKNPGMGGDTGIEMIAVILLAMVVMQRGHSTHQIPTHLADRIPFSVEHALYGHAKQEESWFTG
jgi:hypothetical protein